MKKIFVLISILLILLSSAFSQKDSTWQGSIEEKDGITFIKNPQEPLFGEILLELEKDLLIVDESDPQTAFYIWISLDVDSENNIFVMDRGNHRIQKFDQNGQYLQTIGRKGEGPGEFSKPTFVRIGKNEKILVKDGPKNHIFKNKGDYLMSFPIPLNSNQYLITEEGNFLGERKSFDPKKMAEEIVLLNENGRTLKTITSFPSIDMDAVFNQKSRFNIQPPKLYFCPGGEFTAVFGFSSVYKLIAIDPQGEIKAVITQDEPAEKISGKEKDFIIDYLLKTLKARKPDKEESKDELRRRTFIPKFRPFYERIMNDSRGNLWVLRVRSYLAKNKTTRYDFFNKDGYFLHRIIVPEGITNIAAIRGGYLYRSIYNQEKECFQVEKYKIKNWDLIKDKVN